MDIEVCKTVCKNCPFKTENSDKLYLDEVIENFKDNKKITPCHAEMVKYTGIENKGVELYAEQTDTFKVCRGMVISRMKSDVDPISSVYIKLYGAVICSHTIEEFDNIASLRELV